MSLATPTPVKQWRLGLICAKTLDDASYLDEFFHDKIETISHLYCNGANPLVAAFAQDHGIPYTVFPLTGGRSLPWSNSRIIENSDFAVIIATPQSKSAAKAAEECELKKVRYRLIDFEPCGHWKAKAEKAEEALALLKPEDLSNALKGAV